MNKGSVFVSDKNIVCPKCGAKQCTKDGFIGGKQRYKCKQCSYRHTVNFRGFADNVKRQALILYLQGLDFRSIGKLLQCSHVSVHNWIKPYHPDIERVRSKTGVKIVRFLDFETRICEKTKDSKAELLLIDLKDTDAPALCFIDKTDD